MNSELQQLRSLLVPLVDSFDVDDTSQGLVAWVQVVGGTFVHPLTRQLIGKFKIYGAGRDKVKILQPVFLRSLPAFSVLGLSHPSHLCARVAKMLGEALGRLGKFRDEIASMGITLDLEHDILRLKGSTEIQGLRVEMVSHLPDSLLITHLGSNSIVNIESQTRTMVLSHNAQSDLDELASLVQNLLNLLDKSEPSLPSEHQGKGGFATGKSDVMILTEMVEQKHDTAIQPVEQGQAESPSETSGQDHQQDDLPALRIDYLFEMTGADTEVWAHNGRLRLKIPFRVVQGQYVFYLEQVAHKQFKGVLISPTATRHPVNVDFTSIMDIKEVFDRIMLDR